MHCMHMCINDEVSGTAWNEQRFILSFLCIGQWSLWLGLRLGSFEFCVWYDGGGGWVIIYMFDDKLLCDVCFIL